MAVVKDWCENATEASEEVAGCHQERAQERLLLLDVPISHGQPELTVPDASDG